LRFVQVTTAVLAGVEKAATTSASDVLMILRSRLAYPGAGQSANQQIVRYREFDQIDFLTFDVFELLSLALQYNPVIAVGKNRRR